MHLRKLFFLFSSCIALLSACKKSKDVASQPGTDDDNCITAAGTETGLSVNGRYIVSYNTLQVNARGLSSENLKEISSDLLVRNSIDKNAMLAGFSGEPGGFIAQLSETEAEKLSKDPTVSRVEQDRIIALNTCFTVSEPRLITWNIRKTGYGDGTGKTAWIIDTGIDFDHPDLNVDAGLSKSFIPGSASADDENGHGTHVAGIIGGKNNSIGVLGVASGAKLISLRVLDKNGSGLLSYIVQALAYVNNNARAGDVVNMSVGDEEGVSPTLDEQVRNTAARGIYIAIAAGNEKEAASKHSPARVNAVNVYTVSAIDSLDNFASFSNYGNDVVDYAAPGVRILSAYIGGRYAYMSGTSMAAPHMAGLLLLKGKNINSSGTAKNDPDGTADPIAHY